MAGSFSQVAGRLWQGRVAAVVGAVPPHTASAHAAPRSSWHMAGLWLGAPQQLQTAVSNWTPCSMLLCSSWLAGSPLGCGAFRVCGWVGKSAQAAAAALFRERLLPIWHQRGLSGLLTVQDACLSKDVASRIKSIMCVEHRL